MKKASRKNEFGECDIDAPRSLDALDIWHIKEERERGEAKRGRRGPRMPLNQHVSNLFIR